MNSKYECYISDEIEKLTSKSRFRTLQKNSEYRVNLSSNDYLSIAKNQSFIEEFNHTVTKKDYYTSSSSRLLTGNSLYYELVEEQLNVLFGKQSLVFNSGYHANLGIIPAVAGRKDIIFSDRLNHASIIDGCLLSGATIVRFRHCDYQHLEELLIEKREHYNHCFIISESLFSMDGDCADVTKLVELKNKYDAVLYIDEAHSFGVYGESGAGICAMNNMVSEVDIIVGTFGKAAGSLGAFAIISPLMREFLINKARSLIYSTALPPLILKWTLFILEKFSDLTDVRNDLIDKGIFFRDCMIKSGLQTSSDSFIIPIHIGEDQKTIEISDICKNAGFYILPIRPPTVPEGKARLRISLNTSVSYDDLEKLTKLIAGAMV